MNNNNQKSQRNAPTKSANIRTDRRRRGALWRLVLGGAAAGVTASLPATWTRPIVQSVMLPAHAQTSPGDIADGDFFVELTGIEEVRESIGHLVDYEAAVVSRGGWLDWLIPGAHAGVRSIPLGECFPCGACARIRNGRVTLVLAGISSDPLGQVCFQGAGSIGQSVNLSQVSGADGACTDLEPVPVLGLEGDAPNRTLLLGGGPGGIQMDEDPSRSCDCNAFICLR